MNFSEKLKSLRRQTGMSQEQLAEKLGVSRQAVTKWETDTGIPDIENMMAISTLFGVSLDELLSDRVSGKRDDFLFESVTEYDIAEPKHYDMKFGGAKRLVLSGYSGEKLKIRLASQTLPRLQSDFKIKIDDIKGRIDVDCIANGITEASAKEALFVFVWLPAPYVRKIECAAHAEEVELRGIACDEIELDVKSPRVILDGVAGEAEITCNLDMEIDCKTLEGAVELYQISAASRITVPADARFEARKKGIGNRIFFERSGTTCDPFDEKGAEHLITLKGFNSELLICAREEKSAP